MTPRVGPLPTAGVKEIVVYPHLGGWAFDDASVDLKEEPLVAGADKLMDMFADRLVGSRVPLRVSFDSTAFEGWQSYLTWEGPGTDSEGGGDWYSWGSRRAWLCPALLKYFSYAPQFIFVRVEAA